ncbi:MAG TPA: 3-isopropylmalate dehydratase small subunit [Myxococcota bacterium]|nr:3-isopropylmalate dehydratase small subunit [Myxococcota bacterium]
MSAERVSGRRGRGVVVRGDDIDTDQIIPARYMTSIRFAGLEEFVFRDSRFTQDGVPKGHPFNDRRFRGAEILVVNQNFGCGSSREHAPQALARWGIRALVGESFAEIFFGNCVALGIPAVSAARADVARLMDAVELDPSQEIALDLAARTLTWRGGSAPIKLAEGAREQLMDGSWDAMRTLLDARDQVLAKAESLPYAKGF